MARRYIWNPLLSCLFFKDQSRSSCSSCSKSDLQPSLLGAHKTGGIYHGTAIILQPQRPTSQSSLPIYKISISPPPQSLCHLGRHFIPPSSARAPKEDAPHLTISSNQLRRRIRRLIIGVGRPIKTSFFIKENESKQSAPPRQKRKYTYRQFPINTPYLVESPSQASPVEFVNGAHDVLKRLSQAHGSSLYPSTSSFIGGQFLIPVLGARSFCRN